VVDYPGGVEDLNQKIVRMIGDPEQRFREDPHFQKLARLIFQT